MSDFFDPDEWESTPAPAQTSTPAETTIPAATAPAQPKAVFELKPVGPAPKIEIETIATPAPEVVRAFSLPEPASNPAAIEIPTEFPTFEAPDGMHVDVSDLGIGSEEPLSRKQIRERERLSGSDIIADLPDVAPSLEARLPYDGDLIDQVPALGETSQIETIDVADVATFNASPGMIIEPTTNSIVIDQVQDISNYTATINETGEILTTGSITIPVLMPDSNTGEIKIIKEADALDAAIQADNGAGYINAIAPMRVTGVVESMSKSPIISANLKRGRSQPYAVLATGVFIVLAGSALVAVFFLKLF